MRANRFLNSMILYAALLVLAASPSALAQKASPRLLTPQNSAVIFIDHQPQMAFATHSIDVITLRNNATGLAKAAQVFGVPTLLTTVAEKTFAGPIFPEIQAVFPEQKPIDRTTMNAWEDKRIPEWVKKTGKKKLIIGGLWTEVCISTATLSAIDEGYQVYVVTDASGGVNTEAHDMAVERMIQAGAIPVTWLQVMLEWQRDWARQGTYEAVTGIAKEHAGGYGLGIIYAKTMFGAHEGGH